MSLMGKHHYFNCPVGATFSERSLGKSVGILYTYLCATVINWLLVALSYGVLS
jgi:hypothetical protein